MNSEKDKNSVKEKEKIKSNKKEREVKRKCLEGKRHLRKIAIK